MEGLGLEGLLIILPIKKYMSKANKDILRELEISKGALMHD